MQQSALDLTAPQWAVLSRLAEPGAEDGRTMSEVGDSLGFDRPTTSGIVRRLEAKGWVERMGRQGRAKGLDEAATVDGRVVRVTITAQGARLMERLPALAQAVNRRAARGVAADELAELKRLLALIISNMERE